MGREGIIAAFGGDRMRAAAMTAHLSPRTQRVEGHTRQGFTCGPSNLTMI